MTSLGVWFNVTNQDCRLSNSSSPSTPPKIKKLLHSNSNHQPHWRRRRKRKLRKRKQSGILVRLSSQTINAGALTACPSLHAPCCDGHSLLHLLPHGMSLPPFSPKSSNLVNRSVQHGSSAPVSTLPSTNSSKANLADRTPQRLQRSSRGMTTASSRIPKTLLYNRFPSVRKCIYCISLSVSPCSAFHKMSVGFGEYCPMYVNDRVMSSIQIISLVKPSIFGSVKMSQAPLLS